MSNHDKTKTKTSVLMKNGDINFHIQCPHCDGGIEILKSQLGCQIFRHATYKTTGIAIDPHTTKLQCEMLAKHDMIRGCGKPFKFDGVTISICDYV